MRESGSRGSTREEDSDSVGQGGEDDSWIAEAQRWGISEAVARSIGKEGFEHYRMVESDIAATIGASKRAEAKKAREESAGKEPEDTQATTESAVVFDFEPEVFGEKGAKSLKGLAEIVTQLQSSMGEIMKANEALSTARQKEREDQIAQQWDNLFINLKEEELFGSGALNDREKTSEEQAQNRLKMLDRIVDINMGLVARGHDPIPEDRLIREQLAALFPDHIEKRATRDLQRKMDSTQNRMIGVGVSAGNTSPEALTPQEERKQMLSDLREALSSGGTVY